MIEMFDEINLCLMVNDIILNNEEKNILINKLSSINQSVLFKTKIHGIHHSEKVLLFSYLIGLHEKLSSTEMEILMDAAIYHDIGRTSDDNYNAHGWSSSLRLLKEKKDIVKSKTYDNPANFAYLRAICDAHSLPDHRMEGIFENYHCDIEEMDYNVFERLLKILKDADALDRTRFKNTLEASLREDFLRFDYSKSLIELAKTVNHIYRKKDIEGKYFEYLEKYGKKSNEKNKYGCFHGIGADFFKLESILKKGILSGYAMQKEKIDTSRNFYGSNQDLWISTVDADLIKDDASAYNKYIKTGISLYCFVPNFKSKNDEQGGAADINNKNEHSDERYVFERIDKEQIHSVIVPNNMIYTPVDKLNYLICGRYYEIVKSNVEHYKKEIESRVHIKLDDSTVKKILEDYHKTTRIFNKLNQAEQQANFDRFCKKLDEYTELLNSETQIWMKKYYMYLLKKQDTPLVGEVIEEIMKKYNVCDVYNSNDLNETVILLNPLKKTNNQSRLK